MSARTPVTTAAEPTPASNNPASSDSAKPKENATPTGDSENNDEQREERTFECNICLDTARDAVVSMCGHLFCWPCLHQWLETRPSRQVCPVCKAAINREKVVPLYGRGSTNQQDPREKFPPRPQGQRTEPEPGSAFPGFGFSDNGFHMSFGIGAFPFGFFTSTFNFGDPRPNAAPPGTPQFMDERLLSRLFLWIAIIITLWLILA